MNPATPRALDPYLASLEEWGSSSLALLCVGLFALILIACGSGGGSEVFPPPELEDLGLTEKERAKYSPITFDELFGALEIAADDSEAVEMVIKRVHRKVIGWSGVVQSTRLVKHGAEISEYSLNVAPPSQLGELFPKVYPVLVRAPNDDPVSKFAKGTSIVFVGRLEFDGRSREPWVMDSRLIDIASSN